MAPLLRIFGAIYKGISIHASVNNVLDKDPPLIATDYVGGAGAPNTAPVYDLVGRQADAKGR